MSILEGIPELKAALAQKAEAIRLAAEEAVAQEAELIKKDAQEHAAVRSGELRDGIEVEHEGATATVGSSSHHGAANEYGTSKMPAHPFMHPAAELARERFPKRVEERLRKAIG